MQNANTRGEKQIYTIISFNWLGGLRAFFCGLKNLKSRSVEAPSQKKGKKQSFTLFLLEAPSPSGSLYPMIYSDMKHIKLYESFSVENDVIKIYHGTLSEDDAKSILKNGWDESRRYRAKVEGTGMGAFFSIEDAVYGDWLVEFEVPTNDFRNFIVFDTSTVINSRYPSGRIPDEVIDLAKSINGRVETIEEQILRINGEESLDPNIFVNEAAREEISTNKI